MSKTSPLRRLLVVGSLAAALSTAIHSPTNAEPIIAGMKSQPPDARLLAISDSQSKLLPFANRISTLPSSTSGGLGGVFLNPEAKELTVFWKGELPTGVLAEQRAAAAESVTLKIASSAHTLAELRAEVDRLARLQLRGSGPASSARIETVTPRYDGSGIDVGISGIPIAPTAEVVPLLPGLRGPIPLSIERTASAIPADRYYDRAPYKGGALITRPGYSCTSGFGVRDRANGSKYLLTANHCGSGDWFTGDGVKMGYSSSFIRDRDAMLIKVTDSNNEVWDGASFYRPTDQFTKRTIGSSIPYSGMYICNSGAYSGVICFIRILSTGGFINMTNYGRVYDIATAETADGSSAGGNGDSGGPQVLLNSENSAFYALGTLSAYPGDQSYWVACKGVAGVSNSAEGRHCSRRVYFPDITRQMTLLRDNTGRNLEVMG